MRSALGAVILVLLGALASVPAGLSQSGAPSVVIAFGTPSGTLGTNETVNLPLTVEFTPSPVSACMDPGPLRLSAVQAPPEIELQLEPLTLQPETWVAAVAPGTQRFEARLMAGTTEPLPAFESPEVRVRVEWTGCEAPPDSPRGSAEASTTLSSAYQPGFSIDDRGLVVSDDGTFYAWSVTVVNEANGPTRVVAEVLHDASDAQIVATPPAVVLGRAHPRGDEAVEDKMTFLVAPAPDRHTTLAVRFTGQYAGTGHDLPEPVVHTLSVAVSPGLLPETASMEHRQAADASPGELPGPQVIPVVVLGALAALVFRRRRGS
jgi:hypothetical protein